MKGKMLSLSLFLCLLAGHAFTQDVTCTSGTQSFSVVLNAGDVFSFETAGRRYKPNMDCTATYQLGEDCSEALLDCPKFNTAANRRCTKGDVLTLEEDFFAPSRFCRGNGPDLLYIWGNFTLRFTSDRRRQKGGFKCSVSCYNDEGSGSGEGPVSTSTTSTASPTTGVEVNGLTTADLESLDDILRDTLRGGSGNLPTAVRLTFHDCVGGCDGCININNKDNAGLEDLVAELDALYTENNLSTMLSRADFWAYAGYYSLEQARENANRNCNTEDCIVPELGLSFKYGRTDCDTAPYTDVDVGLPSANLEYSELIDFFGTRFGFTAEETIALMGAHTLGRASVDNSGFRGPWTVNGANELNNQYYSIMADSDAGWFQRNINTDEDPRNQWNAPDIGMMLNADMCIFKDIDLDENGASSCTYEGCDSAPLASRVETYAASNNAWVPDFVAVYEKMVANGYDSLKDLYDA